MSDSESVRRGPTGVKRVRTSTGGADDEDAGGLRIERMEGPRGVLIRPATPTAQ